MIKNVCVFASSSQKLSPIYYQEAEYLGSLLGNANMNIVYGGSRLGMMYACAKAVKDNGGKILGVMPEKLYNVAGVGNPDDCDEFYLTSGMRERKAKMDELSDAVIALAGGFGTLEELSEMIVQKQLGYNAKPIILLNTNGFYSGLQSFFETIIDENFAKDSSRELYCVVNSPVEAINCLKEYVPKKVEISSKF